MLKRRSIKTKLVVALSLLLAITCLLAFSGLWGLTRYRHLANSFVHVATESSLAEELARLATMLQKSNDQLSKPNFSNGYARPLSIIDRKPFEDTGLTVAREAFALKLAIYERINNDRAAGTSLLITPESRDQALQSIRQAYDKVDQLLDEFGPSRYYADGLREPLQVLVENTDQHANILREGMREYSASVKGAYRTWITIALVCAGGVVILVCAMLWSFWTTLVQPFRTLLDGSRLVARGEFGHRIYLETGDELNELADAMNEMSDKFQYTYNNLDSLRKNLEQEVRDRSREVIRNEQLASVGFLAAGVAHEINNPLTTIAWAAESLECQMGEYSTTDESKVNEQLCAALQVTLRQIQEEAFRCKGITDRLLDFSRMSEVRREPIDLAQLVADVVELVSKVGEYRCKTIRTHCDISVIADVNADQIRQVVLNLITNALESVDSNGAVDIRVRERGKNAVVTVDDTGCGMSDDVMKHLFEPFFTRRRDGRGTGLGLSISYRIVSQHGGSLTPSSAGEGHGSRMELLLPRKADEQATNDNTLVHGGTYESQQAA